MSENETRLRQEMHETRQNASDDALWLHVRISKMMDALDALLAEHRAEMETLTVELGEVREELGRLSHSDTRKGILLSTARDAALEEAAERVEHSARSASDFDVAAGIRALKSQPARKYVDAEKVREALMLPSGHPLAAFCAERLRLLELSLDGDAQS